MIKYYFVFALSIVFLSCNTSHEKKNTLKEATKIEVVESPVLNLEQANRLAQLPLHCMNTEYPNKLGQTIGSEADLKTPKELHPAFYGCFDWHSSVHGHWTLLNVLRELSNFEHKEAIWKKLNANLTKENILKEVVYFDDVHNKTFERTYGWAWLLKVSETLQDWNTPEAIILNDNLKPLVALIEKKYIEFLPKLKYPIRVGEHPNTAFGMSFALDYAKKYSPELETIIIEKATAYYVNDKGCPITWEPGGFDFLSPCLQEAALMLKVLPNKEYIVWLDAFLPDFRNNPASYLEVAEVTDRSDGKLAHLDGLNFSRAWCLYEIGNALDNNKMIQLANKHFNYSYKKMDSGEYAGAHWLASFALYATLKSN